MGVIASHSARCVEDEKGRITMKRRDGLLGIAGAILAPFLSRGAHGQNQTMPPTIVLEMMTWYGEGVWFPQMHNVRLPGNENPYMHLGHIVCQQPNPRKDLPGHGKIGFSIPWSGAKDRHLFNWCDRAFVQIPDVSVLGLVPISETERPDAFRYYYPYDCKLGFVPNAVRVVKDLCFALGVELELRSLALNMKNARWIDLCEIKRHYVVPGEPEVLSEQEYLKRQIAS